MRCLSLLLFALLAPLASGQLTVDPLERHVVLSMGKSVKVTVDAGDCTPTWTASSSDDGVATVTPAEGGASSKRSFTIKAADSFGSSAFITIAADGAGAECAEELDVEIRVDVVMDFKAASKFFKKGLKTPLKDMKAASKAVLKDYQDELKSILQQLKDETLGNTEGPGIGLTHAQMADLAVTMGEDALGDSFDSIFDAYAASVFAMKNAGENTALLYGFGAFLDSLPKGFFDGGCGEWDDATKASWELFVGTVNKLNALAKKFDESVMKEVTGEVSLVIYGRPHEIDEFTTGGISIGSNVKEFGAGEKKLEQKRPKATNYIDEDGNNEHGRIRAKGKADPAAGTLTVTYERLDSDGDPVGNNEGDYVQHTNVTIDSKCKWRDRSQDDVEPNLRPGRWRVTAKQGSTEVVKYVTVPTPTAN